MTIEDNKKALEALEKINKILDEVKYLFPMIPKSEVKVKVVNKKYADPLKILKRINGIIVNFNKDNAEIKLKNLLRFLKISINKEK
jgi:hypothetical protein